MAPSRGTVFARKEVGNSRGYHRHRAPRNGSSNTPEPPSCVCQHQLTVCFPTDIPDSHLHPRTPNWCPFQPPCPPGMTSTRSQRRRSHLPRLRTVLFLTQFYPPPPRKELDCFPAPNGHGTKRPPAHSGRTVPQALPAPSFSRLPAEPLRVPVPVRPRSRPCAARPGCYAKVTVPPQICLEKRRGAAAQGACSEQPLIPVLATARR